MSKFLTRTYNTTALAAIGALTGAFAATSIPFLMMNPMVTVLGGGILAMASFIGVNRITPNVVTEHINNVPVYRT